MTERATMKQVSHTHPFDDREPGWRMWGRGPDVVTDGGERVGASPAPRVAGASDGPATMSDVDHTPPYANEDANRVWERGDERDPVREE